MKLFTLSLYTLALFLVLEQTSALLNVHSKSLKSPHVNEASISNYGIALKNEVQRPLKRQSALNVVGGSAVVSSIALPKLSTIIGTTLTPTLLGYYKVEYGVSYAYGTATAVTAALVLRSLLSISSSTMSPFLSLAKLHAAALIFYGVRLNLFLLYREVFIKKFRKLREKIEEKRAKKADTLASRLASRTPFVLGCSFLYAGLAYPTLLSAQMFHPPSVATSSSSLLLSLYKALVYSTWFGFITGAIGDFNKSLIKSIKGEDHLVTGGIYQFLRHPNYTGEIIGWTASFFASLVSLIVSVPELNNQVLLNLLGPVLTSSLGWIGIVFVLVGATAGLETRQFEKYGEQKEYNEWVKKSWKGFALSKK